MIEIKKGREPKELVEYRQLPDASYENMDSHLKNIVLDHLLHEQGHLCAYCMRRIPEKRKLPIGVQGATIEHWFPRNPDSGEDYGQGLDYRNMLAVCSGNRGCGDERNLTCDAKRGNDKLTVNPCNSKTLHSITYSHNGKIKSTDTRIDEDLNERLNLNSEVVSLPENRKQVLDALIMNIKEKHPAGDIKPYCRRKLEQIKSMDDDKIPFVGILIWWLEKHS
ncbi:hypothetical protein OCV99_05680 [Dorea acetigenes]|jgi:uncharacterized protein (TIGR02646 family)|uniref:TIGR02646 family protein n=1 Tax=Dorea acetigenes TaxID=2981787 RepID=A0ABT2RKY6_9FIRM|nr:hypothetical protein [Dorea acetigenes]MCU6686051.1 hypothetical protein [Dorea acetigenes]SCI77164.1 Uncharacterised protein [uncultured Clostridium sp.]